MNIDVSKFKRVKKHNLLSIKFLESIPLEGEAEIYMDPNTKDVLFLVRTSDISDRKVLEIILGKNPTKSPFPREVGKIFWFIKYDKKS